MDENVKSLITDLVLLSVKTHNLLMVAQIPASHSKEAAELMEACQHIYKEFTSEKTDS